VWEGVGGAELQPRRAAISGAGAEGVVKGAVSGLQRCGGGGRGNGLTASSSPCCARWGGDGGGISVVTGDHRWGRGQWHCRAQRGDDGGGSVW
jgi:hypothetical protein